jgi:hypothetical protein
MKTRLYQREITNPHAPALAIHARFVAGCRHTTNTLKSQPVSVGIFFACPPVKTAMTSRATSLFVFIRVYRQQVREVIWSGGGASKMRGQSICY